MAALCLSESLFPQLTLPLHHHHHQHPVIVLVLAAAVSPEVKQSGVIYQRVIVAIAEPESRGLGCGATLRSLTADKVSQFSHDEC